MTTPQEGAVYCIVSGTITANPQLAPLADNGGPTQTMALLPGSPAIDAVSDDTCPPPGTDQRGVTRPQGTYCDIGAFELVQKSTSPPVIEFFESAVDERSLVGMGHGRSSFRKLSAFRNQLYTAADLIDQPSITLACSQLENTLQRIYQKGAAKQLALVKGRDAANLAQKIQEWMGELQCFPSS